jgi:L-lactate dehydrogenase complex protein LldE
MRIALFITCFNDTLYPDTGTAVKQLLERLGHTVHFPQAQTCCGQMHFRLPPRVLPLVRRFAEVFADYDAVVTPSGACAGMIRECHGTLTRSSGEADLAASVRGTASRCTSCPSCSWTCSAHQPEADQPPAPAHRRRP